MTATCADGGGGLSAKGLDISLAALQRHDPYIKNIVDVASQVALYTYNNRANEWVSCNLGAADDANDCLARWWRFGNAHTH